MSGTARTAISQGTRQVNETLPCSPPVVVKWKNVRSGTDNISSRFPRKFYELGQIHNSNHLEHLIDCAPESQCSRRATQAVKPRRLGCRSPEFFGNTVAGDIGWLAGSRGRGPENPARGLGGNAGVRSSLSSPWLPPTIAGNRRRVTHACRSDTALLPCPRRLHKRHQGTPAGLRSS